MSTIPSQTEMTIFEFLKDNLRINYDSYRKHIDLVLTNPETNEEKKISSAYIYNVDD